MWYKKIYSVILVWMVLLTIVKGSCLEYGHSCWGAHGKRSGGGKISHDDTNLNGGEFNILTDASSNNNKNIDENTAALNKLFENFENINAGAENSPHSSDEETRTAIINPNIQAKKLKNLLWKHNSRFRPTRNQNLADLSTMQQERKETHHQERSAERWRKIPLFHLKSFAKTPLNVATAENDLLQQLESQEAAAAAAAAVARADVDGEGVFYDFK